MFLPEQRLVSEYEQALFEEGGDELNSSDRAFLVTADEHDVANEEQSDASDVDHDALEEAERRHRRERRRRKQEKRALKGVNSLFCFSFVFTMVYI